MRDVEKRFLAEYQATDADCRKVLLSGGLNEYVRQLELALGDPRPEYADFELELVTLQRLRRLAVTIRHDRTGSECAEADLRLLKDFHARLTDGEDAFSILNGAEYRRLHESRAFESLTGGWEEADRSYTPPKKWDAMLVAIVVFAILCAVAGVYLLLNR